MDDTPSLNLFEEDGASSSDGESIDSLDALLEDDDDDEDDDDPFKG